MQKIMAIETALIIQYTEETVHHTEECHGIHDLGGIDIQIESVKVYVGDNAIDLTKILTKQMEDEIYQAIQDGIQGI